jgi:hypothetical protein
VSVVLAIGARLAEQRRREQQEREAASGWQGCLFIAEPEAEAGQ